MQKGLAGVFFWEVTHDRMSDNSHPLVEAAAQAVNESADAR